MPEDEVDKQIAASTPDTPGPRSLSATPSDCLSLTKVLEPICTGIREAVGNQLDPLVELLGEDVLRGPPRAIWRAAFERVFFRIGRGTLQVYALHPTSGVRVSVPAHLFLSAEDPEKLFFHTGWHEHAGVAEHYQEFCGCTFFVDQVEGKRAATAALAEILDRKRSAPKAPTTDSLAAWVDEALSAKYWPIGFALTYMESSGYIQGALQRYGASISDRDSTDYEAAAFSAGEASIRRIEALFRNDQIECLGSYTVRFSAPEPTRIIPSESWIELEIYFPERRIHAAPRGMVPPAYCWENLYVQRKQLLAQFSDEHAASEPRPDKITKARDAAIKLWGVAIRPDGMSQVGAHATINEHLDPDGKDSISLTTVLRALGERKK